MREEMYSRHYPIIGKDSQYKLRKKKVVVVGAGALGSYSVHFLKKLGVENIRVIDGDFLEISDLPRTIYTIEDVGKPKVKILENVYGIEGILETLTPNNVYLLNNFDLIMDATDNIRTRLLINEFAVKNNIPWVNMAVLRTYGYVMGIIPHKTACYRCYIPEKIGSLPTCAIEGIMPYVPPTAAAIGVSIAEKILLEKEIKSEMIYFNLHTNEFHRIEIPRREDCPVCSQGIYEMLEGKSSLEVRETCSGVEINPGRKFSVNLNNIRKYLDNLGIKVSGAENYLRFRENEKEIIIFSTGRMLVKGGDKETALRYYSRFIGY